MQLNPSSGSWTKCFKVYISVSHNNYIDDILIASSSPDKHKQHLCLVLERLQKHGILVNPNKCVWGASQLDFLGHRVDSHGIQPLEDKVQVIQDFPRPCTSQRKLREFLGLVNFYRRFIPTCARVLHPLNLLLTNSVNSTKTIDWTDSANIAFTSTITTDWGRQFESSLWTSLMHLLGSTRCRTTAYHPSANGLVERFHWQLKSSLKALPESNKWSEALPLILLGIRSALKTDLRCCTAELVYSTTLRLPGEFFSPTLSIELADPADYVTQLKLIMSKLKATPVCKQSVRSTHIHDDLSTCTHVYIRQDGVRKPLQKPYKGPYKVLK